MDEVATMFSFNNWFGHFSYLLIAISYWLTDIFWLRLVAVVGLSFEILYFWHSGGDLRTGIGWDLIFILINAYQLYRLLRDRLSLRLPEADRDLLRSSGRVGVSIAGREVSQLERGNFVGEVAFLTEKPATATVIAEGNVRALVFERDKLSQFFQNETEVAGLIYQLLGRELAQKIKVSNQLISPASSLA